MDSGVTLTDLIFVDEGNPTYLEDGRINFEKQRLLAKLIRELLQFQNQQYSFARERAEYAFTREFPLVEESQLYALSLKREPRGCALKDVYETFFLPPPPREITSC